MNRLSTARRAAVLTALVEGNSIRATCRITGSAKGTVLRLLRDTQAMGNGETCERGGIQVSCRAVQPDRQDAEPALHAVDQRLQQEV